MNVRRNEQGAIAIMFAMLLVTIVALAGFAIDLAHAYTRRIELQAVADAAALAAARALDGSLAGITAASTKAQDLVARNVYAGNAAFVWSSGALRFSEDPDAPDSGWLDAGAITSSNVQRIRYARLDTAGLGGEPGTVATTLMAVLVSGRSLGLRAIAVAGRATSHILPLGVCAIDQVRYTQRVHNAGVNNELVEHGFRRGVGYNLLNLNPTGATPVSYLINPVDLPPAANQSGHLASGFVAPFVCAGAMAGMVQGSVHVSEPFPPSLVAALNSRFNQYAGGLCTVQGAPPDSNILSYNGTQPAGWWMNGVPNTTSAKSAIEGGKLLTVADIAIPTPLTNGKDMGTLWSFSSPVAYDPAAPNYAGAAFVKTDWPYLYPSSPAVSSVYLNTLLPYIYNQGSQRQAPATTGLRYRRILYVPLLACPVGGSEATVLAIGKFLMTAPATTSPLALHAEFGGLAREGELTHSVVLYK